MKNISIRVKFLVPIILVILLGTLCLGTFAYISQRKTLTHMMQDTTELKIKEVGNLIVERQASQETAKETLNKFYISITKAVALDLEGIPDKKLTKEITLLVQKLSLDEIHVTNDKGIIIGSNVPGAIGFDLSSTKESNQLMAGLNQTDFALALDAQVRSSDNKTFKYIGVSRVGKPGIVQIGIGPDTLNSMKGSVDIGQIANEVKLGKQGYIFIFDSNGNLVSRPQSSTAGTNLKDYSWGSKIAAADRGSFTYTFKGEDKFLSFEKTKDYVIIATLPTSEYYDQLNTFKVFIPLNILLIVILCSIIIYFLSNSIIIKRINYILNGITKIGSGDLNITLEDFKKDELGQLTSGLNIMTDNLKNLVEKITTSAVKLQESADCVSESTNQTSISSNEIAHSVNEIAIGTNNQATEIQTSVGQLHTVEKDIKDIVDSSSLIEEKVNQIDRQNQQSINTVNDLKSKFADNKNATNLVKEKISHLSESSNKIGVITESITAISSQTSLLSLNASIEAARAGEAGRGFSVVADEVRVLSEQSAKAAIDIDSLIKTIRQDIEEAVDSINIASTSVNESDEKLNNTITIFNSLKESNDSLILLIDKLNTICESLEYNTNQVTGSMNTIASVAEETAATSEEISASTEEQSAMFEEITISINGIKELTNELAEMIRVFRIK